MSKVRPILRPWVAKPMDPSNVMDGPWLVEGKPFDPGGPAIISQGISMADALDLAAGDEALGFLQDVFEQEVSLTPDQLLDRAHDVLVRAGRLGGEPYDTQEGAPTREDVARMEAQLAALSGKDGGK